MSIGAESGYCSSAINVTAFDGNSEGTGLRQLSAVSSTPAITHLPQLAQRYNDNMALWQYAQRSCKPSAIQPRSDSFRLSGPLHSLFSHTPRPSVERASQSMRLGGQG